MKIVSLVLKYPPEHNATLQQAVEAVPGASVAHDDGAGRMIVLIEDGEGYAVSDSIIEVHQLPHVMSFTLAYEYSDQDENDHIEPADLDHKRLDRPRLDQTQTLPLHQPALEEVTP